MTIDEINVFLAEEHTCRVATLTASGRPHVAPLWFVWDQTHLWVYWIVKSQRWADLTRNPNIAVVINAGADYLELRGVEIRGQAVVVGEVPRTDTQDPELRPPELLRTQIFRHRPVFRGRTACLAENHPGQTHQLELHETHQHIAPGNGLQPPEAHGSSAFLPDGESASSDRFHGRPGSRDSWEGLIDGY